MSKAFWAKHSIKGQNPSNQKPKEPMVTNPGGVFGPTTNAVPAEAATKGIARRSEQVRATRQKLADVTRTSLVLGADDPSAEAKAEKDVEVAESGYRRQANESARRVAKRKT